MTTVNGYETIFGAKVEATAGTAIQLVAGDRVDVTGIKLSPKFNLGRDEDSLIPTVKKTWLKTTIPVLELSSYLQYWSLEKFWAVLMGGCTATAHHSGHPLAATLEYGRATIAKALTGAFSLGEGQATANMLRIQEVSGARIAEVEIDQGNGEEPKVSWTLVGKAQTRDSTINTTGTIDEITFPDASYPSRPATFDDVTVKLAHQSGDSFDTDEEIDASGFTVKIMPGIPTDTEKHLSTKGAMLPAQLERKGVEIALRFLRDDTASDVFRQYAEENERMKLSIAYASDEGLPGISVSDASPSTNIAGGTDTKLKITFTDAVTSEAESKEITLTLTGLTTGALIAAAIQAGFRAAVATNMRFQRVYDSLVCTHNSTVANKYAITLASKELVNIAVVAASANDVAVPLKLGAPGSGVEDVSVAYAFEMYIPEIVFDPIGENVEGGVNEVEFKGIASTSYGATAPFGFDADDHNHLTTDLNGNNGEDIRLVTVGRVLTSPIA